MSIVTVYSQPACPHCERVKRQLTGMGITYEEINVQRNDAARTKITEEWGYRQVPVVEFEEDTILNPNPTELEEFIYGSETSVFDF